MPLPAGRTEPHSRRRASRESRRAWTSRSSASTSARAASTAASAPAAETKSTRGNLVKTLGQAAGISDPTTKKQLANFVVSAIQPVTCTEPYAAAATSGHLIALDISIDHDAGGIGIVSDVRTLAQ